MSSPHVCCVCVTQAGRTRLLDRSILSFERQTHPSKELVLVTDGGDQAFVDTLHRVAERATHGGGAGRGVRVLTLPGTQNTLGALRDHARQMIDAGLIVQWDDDDQSHPARLAEQVARLVAEDAAAAFYTDQFHYLEPANEVYWTTAATRGKEARIPGTIMHRASLTIPYVASDRKHEDSHFRDAIVAAGHPVVVITPPVPHYLRTYHGENTWGLSHHRALIASRAHPVALLAAARDAIVAALRELTWPRATVRVMGRDGLAFEVAL